MIKMKNISKVFNEDTQINIKNINFENGKSYALLGPSGSGKTTLMNMISGIISPTSGGIIIDDIDITKLSEKEKDLFRLNNIGYIFQDFKLIEEMTVEDNLELVRIAKKDTLTIKEVLQKVGLENKLKEKVKNLSGGEKQRIAIARALMKQPKIILADEPTGNLNHEKGLAIMQLLKEFHQKSKYIMIFVTHDDRMAQFADVIINFEDLLEKGGGKNV